MSNMVTEYMNEVIIYAGIPTRRIDVQRDLDKQEVPEGVGRAAIEGKDPLNMKPWAEWDHVRECLVWVGNREPVF